MKSKFDTIKAFFEEVWKNPEAFPDKAIVLPLEKERVTEIFTKKRIEIIKVARRHKELSVTEIAKTTQRKLSAVARDIKLLSDLGIVHTRKQGRITRVSVTVKILILPLIELQPISI